MERKIKIFRRDNGCEYLGKEFSEYLEKDEKKVLRSGQKEY